RAPDYLGSTHQTTRFFPSYVLTPIRAHPPPAPRAAGGLTQPPRVPGFSFLVNAVWPELVAMLDQKIPAIFAPGNPDNFHKNYTATMEFVSSFESLCPNQASVRKLRAHPSFNLFLAKWSLPVYFQIRFQEIAGVMENSLSLTPAQGMDMI
ncbi:Conserved oligomeric Golgi complex subunit 2, partial [Geodia barretti]